MKTNENEMRLSEVDLDRLTNLSAMLVISPHEYEENLSWLPEPSPALEFTLRGLNDAFKHVYGEYSSHPNRADVVVEVAKRLRLAGDFNLNWAAAILIGAAVRIGILD